LTGSRYISCESRRREVYIGDARLCVCLSVCVCVSVRRRMPTPLHGPECNIGNGRKCPLVVHYCANLQSVHGFRCYDNTARCANAKFQRVLVLPGFIILLVQRVLLGCRFGPYLKLSELSKQRFKYHRSKSGRKLPQETFTTPPGP